MFTIEKDRLVESLEVFGQYYCSYKAFTGQLCDCKYRIENGQPQYMSECFCGCPEMKLAKVLFSVMTKKEYKVLIAKLEKKLRLENVKRNRRRKEGPHQKETSKAPAADAVIG